jgi:multicomponent Na+:H+ antiporter subunit D
MIEHIPISMIAGPLTMATLMIFLRSQPTLQKYLSAATTIVLFLLSILLIKHVWSNGMIVYEVGEWGKYGIILVADKLSSLMVLLSSFISMLAMIYSLDYIESNSQKTTYHALYLILLAGLNGSFLTGDIFNLFVFFEILLLSSCGLVVAVERGGVTTAFAKMEATYKYLVLNMLGSFIMLVAISLIYATVGTVNMADISIKLSHLSQNGTLPWYIFPAGLLFIVVFGNKAAIFPLHYWLPDVHPTAPSPISAMLSGVMIKVGAYGVIRVYYYIFKDVLPTFQTIIIWIALATIVVGAISAIGQTDVKRLLAYSSVGQIGYIFLGIGIGTPLAIAASLVYIINHGVAKSLLFLTSGGIIHHAGTRDMLKMGGMLRSSPVMGWAFLIGAMSISGMPPLGGFIAKFLLFDAGIKAEFYLPIAIALVAAIFTLFYLFKAWHMMFWGEERKYESHPPSPLISVPIILLAITTVLLGIYAQPLVEFCMSAAQQVVNPELYIETVLNRVVR